MWLAWTPLTLTVSVFDPSDPSRRATGEAAPAAFDLWVAEDGSVVSVGSAGVAVMGATVYSEGRRLVSPPAVRLWRETAEASRMVLSGSSPEGYVFDVITSNAALVMLVTGFETYCQTRFRELDREGVPPNHAALLRRFGSVEERRQLAAGTAPAILDADDATAQLLRRINFQSYDACKRAWNSGYGLRFGDAIANATLGRVQRLLTYRHRIVHVSPLVGVLNGPESPPEEPEFSQPSFARDAASSFTDLVEALHATSLTLRPPT